MVDSLAFSKISLLLPIKIVQPKKEFLGFI